MHTQLIYLERKWKKSPNLFKNALRKKTREKYQVNDCPFQNFMDIVAYFITLVLFLTSPLILKQLMIFN